MRFNKEKLLEYFYSNLASVFWSFFLILGGAVFVIYYARIGYMPNFDLSSSVAIVAATSVTSVIIFALLLVMTVMPGVFWNGVWNELGGSSNIKRYWTGPNQGRNLLGVLFWFATPLISIYASLVIYFFWGAAAIALPGFLFIGMLCFLCKKSVFGRWKGFKEWVFVVGATIASGALIFAPLSVIFKLSVSDNYAFVYPSWLAGSVAVLLIISANILSAYPEEGKPYFVKIFILGLSSLFLIFWIFNKFDSIPMAVMRIYKFGNINASSMVFDSYGCKVVDSLGIRHFNKDGDMCVIKDIVLLSRLGDEMYLEVSKEGGGLVRFTLPHDRVISWSEKIGR